MHLRLIALVLLFASIGLSGCIGGGDDVTPDDDADDKGADQAVAEEGVGSITGQVLSTALEPVAAASIALQPSGTDAEPLSTLTDKQGRYTVNGITPGPYLFRIDSYGFRSETRNVDIVGGEITELSLQLDILSDAELGLPFIDAGEFKGFLACGAGQAILPPGVAPAPADGGVNPRTSPCGSVDPNDKFLFDFHVQAGLQEVVMGMTWEPVGGLSGRELNLNLEREDCDVSCTDADTYIDISGPPDIVFQIRDGDVPDDLAFSKINDTREMRIRIFPAATQTPNLMYQQPYTIYYEFYYNQLAPEGRNPIPDL